MAQAPPREGRLEGRIPPQDLDAEQSVLGAILIDPTALARVLQLLDASDFYRENNGRIYAACVSLFGDSEPIDNVTVAARLEQQGVLERVGGRAQLALLQESVPTAANVEHYAKIVKAKSYKRKLISAGGAVTALGYDDSLEADDALNKATSVVYAAAEDRIQTELAPLTTLLRPAMDRIDAQMASGQGVIGVPSGFYDLDRLTSGFKSSDLVIVAGRPAMGKCLTAGTLIDDPETGERVTIERWVKERRQTVWGVSDGGDVRPTEVGDWVDSGIKEAFRVRTRTGRTVEVTGHHPFLTATGWQPLHDLVVGDAIAVPRQVPCFGSDTSLDPGLVRILGYLVAEGGLTHTSPAFSNTDAEILEDFKQIVADQYPRLHLRHDGRCTWFVSGRWGGRDVNPLTAWLREVGLWGKGALEKRFPEIAWRWDRERLREFIRALFSCDATLYAMAGYPRIEFTVASRELAEDAQHALTRFGIVSKLWRKTPRSWRVEVTDPESVATYQSQIGWIGEKSKRFATSPMARHGNRGHLPVQTWTLVRSAAAERGLTLAALAAASGEHEEGRRGFNPHARRRLPRSRLAAYAGILDDAHLKRISNPDLYWDEIASIEPIGRHQVYDLTVPDGANFIAQDVVVHNTSFVLNLALHAAVSSQIPVAVFSLEMSKEQLVERLLCQQAKIDSQRLHRGLLGDAEYERLVMAIGPLENAPIYIDDAPVLDELTLLLKARQAKVRHNIGLVLLDYLQLMQGRGRGDDNRVQEVSQISRSLKGLARELKVPVIAISQLSRAPEARPNKRPMLSDLRESGCLTGEARVFLPDEGVYRPIAELVGRTGFHVLALNPETWKLERRVVTNSFPTGSKPVWRLTTKSGRSIRATANHKFLTVDGWKRLDEINVGDHVALPRALPSPDEQSLGRAELALLGHLIGDGCTLPRHAIQYTTVDYDLANLVAGLAYDLFWPDLAPRVERQRSWYQVYLSSRRHLTHGQRNPVAAWLDRFGVFGLRSWEKFVPDAVFRQPLDEIAVFLRHLWATDGCVNLQMRPKPVPSIYYSSSSARLATEVQSLLLRFGINASSRRISQGTKGRTQHQVWVTGKQDMTAFLTRVEVAGLYRMLHGSAIEEFLEGIVENTNRDVVPAAAWAPVARAEMAAAGVTQRGLAAGLQMSYMGSSLFEQNFSRQRARRLAGFLESPRLAALSNSDVYWDPVKSIEPDGVESVYDLTVEGLHNFVAEDIVVHNSIEQDADIVMFLYRDEYYNDKTEKPGIAEVIVAKHRNGPTDTIELRFRKDQTLFYNLESRRGPALDVEPAGTHAAPPPMPPDLE